MVTLKYCESWSNTLVAPVIARLFECGILPWCDLLCHSDIFYTDLKKTVVSLIQRIESLETENSLLREEMDDLQAVQAKVQGENGGCNGQCE